MKFLCKLYKTPLTQCIEEKNIEIIKFLLVNDKLDINKMSILEFIKFK